MNTTHSRLSCGRGLLPARFSDGVARGVFVEESDERIAVELIPEDEATGEQGPADMLRLPRERQHEILDQLRLAVDRLIYLGGSALE